MTFTEIVAPQRSEDWFAARVGRLCASDAAKMLDTIQRGESAKRRDLRWKLVAERLSGRPQSDDFSNADMERGVTLEPQARVAYEFLTGVNVREVGFLQCCEHMVGASPDGVIGDFDGLVEIKAPRTAKHILYRKGGEIPAEHRPQLIHQLWVSNARYVDFVSFDPTLPEQYQLFVKRLERNEDEIATYAKKALAFLEEVQAEIDALETVSNLAGQLKAAVA